MGKRAPKASHQRSGESFKAFKSRYLPERLAQLDKQIANTRKGSDKAYLDELRRLEQEAKDISLSESCEQEFLTKQFNEEYVIAKKVLREEADIQLKQIKEKLIAAVILQKQQYKERFDAMQIDVMETDLIETRRTRQKLRRRGEEEPPSQPSVHERDETKAGPILVFELEDEEIVKDINTLGPKTRGGQPHMKLKPKQGKSVDIYYEQDRLYYDGRWLYRGSKVTVEGRDTTEKFPGVIYCINQARLYVRRDDAKFNVRLSQLAKGEYILRFKSGNIG